jgi:hypothetical protein
MQVSNAVTPEEARDDVVALITERLAKLEQELARLSREPMTPRAKRAVAEVGTAIGELRLLRWDAEHLVFCPTDKMSPALAASFPPRNPKEA